MLRVRFTDGEVIEYPDAEYVIEEKNVITLHIKKKQWVATLVKRNVKSIESCRSEIQDPIIITKQNDHGG